MRGGGGWAASPHGGSPCGVLKPQLGEGGLGCEGAMGPFARVAPDVVHIGVVGGGWGGGSGGFSFGYKGCEGRAAVKAGYGGRVGGVVNVCHEVICIRNPLLGRTVAVEVAGLAVAAVGEEAVDAFGGEGLGAVDGDKAVVVGHFVAGPAEDAFGLGNPALSGAVSEPPAHAALGERLFGL